MLERDGRAAREWWRWARIGAAITPESPEAADFVEFGTGSYLAFPQGAVESPGRIRIGAGCVVNEGVTLAAGLPGDTAPGRTRIDLGDGCVLGRGTEILALGRVELGPRVWTASRVTIVDHDHRRDQVNVPVASQTPLRVGTVSIGEGSVISTGAIILANAWIGRYCTVAAGALVRAGHYPDHSLIAGVPAAIKPFPSRPVPNLDEPVPLDVPAGLPLEHDDPAVQAHLDAYRQAHAAAAASPTPDSYREVAYRIEPLLKTLDYVNDGELWNALQLRAAEFAAQANRFPTAAGIQS